MRDRVHSISQRGYYVLWTQAYILWVTLVYTVEYILWTTYTVECILWITTIVYTVGNMIVLHSIYITVPTVYYMSFTGYHPQYKKHILWVTYCGYILWTVDNTVYDVGIILWTIYCGLYTVVNLYYIL